MHNTLKVMEKRLVENGNTVMFTRNYTHIVKPESLIVNRSINDFAKLYE